MNCISVVEPNLESLDMKKFSNLKEISIDELDYWETPGFYVRTCYNLLKLLTAYSSQMLSNVEYL